MADDVRPETTPEPEVALPKGNRGIVAEFIDFLLHEKVWWMTPIIVVILLMVAFILFAESSPVLPFIYTIV